ncbi:MAG: hypothetical protein HQ582_10535 [Planctomycetes bacterium]|nr:hypothetical protein [Planctomycetota bacterium]
MSVTTLYPPSPSVRLTPFPGSRRAPRLALRQAPQAPEGAREAQETRERQAGAWRVQKGYEAAECLTYAAEAVVDAGHHGKAGIILSVACNILIRARYQAASGQSPGGRPSKILLAMRKCPNLEAEEVDRLADALGGAATTSLSGLSRVVDTLREVLDGLTNEEESE